MASRNSPVGADKVCLARHLSILPAMWYNPTTPPTPTAMLHLPRLLAHTLLLATAVAPLAASLAADMEEAGGEAKRLVIGEVPEHTVGAYRPFMIPGEIDEADGFTELRKGRTITIWCPERVTDESPEKVASAKRFVELPFLPIGSVSVGYVGNSAGESILKDLGVRYTTYGQNNVYDLEKQQVVVLGPGTDAIFRDENRRGTLKSQLASHLLLVLPGADLSLLPLALSRQTATPPADAAAATVPNLPLFAGTAPDFRDFITLAKGAQLPVLGDAPAWTIATAPACIAHVKNRSLSIVIFSVAPRDVPEAARPALTRVWCTIFANLNIESGCDMQP